LYGTYGSVMYPPFCKLILQLGTSGVVVGIEHMEALVDLSLTNIRKHHADLLDSGKIVIVQVDVFVYETIT
jgi:hypothetical protein